MSSDQVADVSDCSASATAFDGLSGGRVGVPIADRRRYPRYALIVPVVLTVRDEIREPVATHIVDGSSRDISRGGLRLCTANSVPCGSVVVGLPTPRGEHLTIPARVVHCWQVGPDLWDYGLEFDQPLSEARLESLVNGHPEA